MTATTHRFPSVSRSKTRGVENPPVWNRPKITFVSTCPKCGHSRLQHGYTRRTLFNLLSTRHKIDAYCSVCNVCWPISESERRVISHSNDLYGSPKTLESVGKRMGCSKRGTKGAEQAALSRRG